MTSGACPGSALTWPGNQSMHTKWHIIPHSPGRALTGGISAHQWHNISSHTVLALTVGISAHQWHIIVTLSCHWPEMHYSSKTLKSTSAVINIPWKNPPSVNRHIAHRSGILWLIVATPIEWTQGSSIPTKVSFNTQSTWSNTGPLLLCHWPITNTRWMCHNHKEQQNQTIFLQVKQLVSLVTCVCRWNFWKWVQWLTSWALGWLSQLSTT